MSRIARRRRAGATLHHRTTIALIAGALVVAPAGACAATTWFGSSLNHDPANAGLSCNPTHPSAPGRLCTRVGSYFPGTSGRVKAPVAGTIVKIRIRPQGPMKLTFKLVRLRHVSSNHESGQAKVIETGPKLTVKGPSSAQLNNGVYPIESFPVH